MVCPASTQRGGAKRAAVLSEDSGFLLGLTGSFKEFPSFPPRRMGLAAHWGPLLPPVTSCLFEALRFSTEHLGTDRTEVTGCQPYQEMSHLSVKVEGTAHVDFTQSY